MTASDDVILLKVRSVDIRNNMPKECLTSIKEDAAQRVDWIKLRSKEILESEFKNEGDRRVQDKLYKHTKASYPVAARPL